MCLLSPWFLLSTSLLVADWGQTRYITSAYPRYYESNVLLGERPSMRKVDTHFTLALTGNAVVGCALPKRYRKYWWGAVSLLEAGYVANNYTIGVGWKWN